MTKQVQVGGVAIGGDARVTIQSMTNTDTRDVPATLQQIRALADAGCDIVRVSVYDEACARAVRALVDGSPVPLVADIHFDHRLAILALENGIQKLRINPGNIGGEANVKELADALKARRVPVRIGVNSGSVEKDILRKYGGPTPQGMVESALGHARLLEKYGFDDLVLSIKASNARATVEANRLASKACDYPLHIGVTEAGSPGMGTIKSAVGIGALLVDGIGDTVRVSLSGDPVNEVYAREGNSEGGWRSERGRGHHLLPHLRPDADSRSGNRRKGASGHAEPARSTESRGHGLHCERPGRSARGRHRHRRGQGRRRAVCEGREAARGARRSGRNSDP